MQHVKLLKLGAVALIAGLGSLATRNATADPVIATGADGVDMWDGQWHFGGTVYAWVPWIYSSPQLPPIAGGGNPNITTQPSQYLKYLNGAAELEGTVRKGDWSLWSDLVYMHLSNGTSNIKQVGLPGVDPTLPVSIHMNFGLKATILTFAPTYTLLHGDIGSLDVLAGLRYIDVSQSFNLVLSGPRDNITRGIALYPGVDSWDGILGVRGTLRLSSDGKWFLPYETDLGKGNGNTQWNAILGVGYHFHWGDVTLGGRNLTVNRAASDMFQNVRFTGPALAATFRW